MPGGLKNWNGSSRADSGVLKQACMQPREDRRSPHTLQMMTACIKAFETWGTYRRVSFPMRFPRVFQIEPRFNPICFAQSPPLLPHIPGPKGRAFYLSMDSSSLGRLHNSNMFFFCDGLIFQIGSLQKQKVGLVRHAPTN